MTSSPGCSLCNGGGESIVHALRDCPFAVSVQRRVVHPSKLSLFMSMPFLDWFTTNLRVKGRFTVASNSWEYLFSMLCWLLWKRRCSIIMDRSFIEHGDILLVGRRMVQEMCSVAVSQAHAGSGKSCSREVLRRGWVVLCHGWVKVNSDGACALNTGQTAVGGALSGNAIVDDIREMLSQDLLVVIRRISRDGNKGVDAFATSIRDGSIGVWLFDSPSSFVSCLLSQDLYGVSGHRDQVDSDSLLLS
ncbi:hypothetical protein V6N12_070494 [Hibiscus sabdariffa]|uniref:RNase H type-1 domain-containing protein n=1 Tax=Hibiscus sabdariffa TaxID=183260 RepID=A0ABR2FGZ0_9ROSI